MKRYDDVLQMCLIVDYKKITKDSINHVKAPKELFLFWSSDRERWCGWES